MGWEMEFGYAENVGTTTIGKTTRVILVGLLIRANRMCGYVHAVKSTIGKTGIVTDAIVSMKAKLG